MPSAKYYRSILPLDILQIVGNYAGDDDHILKFTLSPKRGFLSNILMIWRHPSMYCGYTRKTSVLTKENWRPVRLGCVSSILIMLGESCKLPANILVPEMKKITEILLEIHNYKLSARKVWTINKYD